MNFINVRIAPKGINVYNLVFDAALLENITAIIMEKGVIQWPTEEKIKKTIKS